jgi:signal transduction histidine kinase/DNA-binding response OmpR family regulator
MEVRLEHDVVLARQRARQVAGLLGFELQDQTRIATAVSEIARNAFHYAGGGKVEFFVEEASPPSFLIRIRDRGPGIKDLRSILDGRYRSATGMGLGIVGVRRLMDGFQIDSAPGAGTTVVITKTLTKRTAPVTVKDVARIGEELARRGPQNPFEEVQHQNQELLRTLEELKQREAELTQANADLRRQKEALAQLNQELDDTNRGVVALYAELDEKADYLRRASEMKSRFLSNMSHEFRSPLNTILGLGRLLLDRTDGDLTPEQEKQVKLMCQSAEGLTELVNDLLDLAKVEAGKVIVRPYEFDVGALFGALRGMLKPLLAHNSSVSLVFEDPVDVVTLHTDESKVSQILRNFISNALKFTERGEVRVSVTAGPENMVSFAVADTGAGIAPEYQDLIFQEFTQVDNPRQKYVKGTGLGLPLVKKLAELLGGHVALRSEVGVGSTFSVVLPYVYQGPMEVAYVPEVTTQPDPARRPVLVVEDNRETLFLYEKFLKGSSFQAIPARTVREARRAVEQVRPAAVVLDVMLEGESTWDLLAELKQRQATQDIPILVVTLVDNQHKAMALGADAFRAKPVDRRWLLDTLSAVARMDRPESILLIDDDPAACFLLKGHLAATRFQVIEAANGREGLRLAQQEQPRAIFLDLQMPGLDGYDVLNMLQADPATCTIPVLVHTSQILASEDRQRLARAVAIIPKEGLSREVVTTRLRESLGELPVGKEE